MEKGPRRREKERRRERKNYVEEEREMKRIELPQFSKKIQLFTVTCLEAHVLQNLCNEAHWSWRQKIQNNCDTITGGS